jgi:hypothetical protein
MNEGTEGTEGRKEGEGLVGKEGTNERIKEGTEGRGNGRQEGREGREEGRKEGRKEGEEGRQGKKEGRQAGRKVREEREREQDAPPASIANPPRNITRWSASRLVVSKLTSLASVELFMASFVSLRC